MWVLEFITFVMAITTVCSIVIPWSIMLKEYNIEPDCMLGLHFQFREWGTACGYTWPELQTFHQVFYFAFANVMPDVRVLSMISAVTANLLMFYVIAYGTDSKLLTVSGLTVGVLSVLASSDYSNAMDSTMTLPPKYLLIKGPGYLLQLLSAAYGGSLLFIQFYISYYRRGVMCDEKTEGNTAWVRLCLYTLSILSIVSSFGDLVKIDKCTDMVTVFDKNQCPYCSSPLFGAATAFAVINVWCSVSSYLMKRFLLDDRWYKWWVVNAYILLSTTSSIALLICTLLLDNVERMGWAVYVCGVEIVIGAVVFGVYNHLLHSPDQICSGR